MNSLTRTQFTDHLPEVLAAFEQRLRTQARDATVAEERSQKLQEVKHGLQRWQQGYQLPELLREWGHLQLALFNEIAVYETAHPEIEREALQRAHRELILLVNDAISESTGQYVMLSQAEAAGRVNDLQNTLTQVKELERHRATLIHQAVHDLRGNVQSVSSAADVLQESDLEATDRATFLSMLQQGVSAVSEMLVDLMELARLEAGQERRELGPFDAAALLGEFCATTQSTARARNLYLNLEGPATLPVEGDAGKVRRMAQNLVVNALKYTEQGGVTVSFGADGAKWWLRIKDTGPGILSGPGAPLVSGMQAATASARESDAKAPPGGSSHVLPLAKGESPNVRQPPRQQSGEGIGLSIVKRMCELLDASLELSSSAESGTTFRIVFPRRYGAT